MADLQMEVTGQQLDTLTRIAALILVKDSDKLSDQIELLRRTGLKPKVIAELLDTTPNTVSVQLSRTRALGRGRRSSIAPGARRRESHGEEES
jgi:DNA-binding NarL/FixJ family response regulator